MGSLALDDCRIPVIWREAYGGPLTDIVMQAKYHGDWGSARFLGRSLGRLPRPWLGPTPLIIPIPLASTRLANRGFNQSQFIAQGVAKAWQAPLRVRWLRKTKASARQASLQRQERQENLKGVFWACRHLRDQRVVLVDDIMTSGATLREAARAVATGGGQVIAAAVIARVHHDREPLQSKQKHTPYVQRRPV
ncbi:phosphoribosyltransferase family protein [beta proteobacterium MWH-UniP1]